jgi:hypothetical protein
MWGNMFYHDDPRNGALAHEMGIVFFAFATLAIHCQTRSSGKCKRVKASPPSPNALQ